MEEASHPRKTPLTVAREFAGSRLEQQILSRVYELAVPILRRRTTTTRASPARTTAADNNHQPQRIAQGG
jgi:hypothetical protein